MILTLIFEKIQKEIAQYAALKRSLKDQQRRSSDVGAVLYEYRTQIVRGSMNTLVIDAEVNWLAQYIKRDEYSQLFGGFLCTGDAGTKPNRYRGVWGKDKVRKFKGVLRQRGAVFTVKQIDGKERSINLLLQGSLD